MTEEFKIEQSIPIPLPRTGPTSRWNFLKEMKVGESFFWDKFNSTAGLGPYKKQWEKQTGYKFTTRKAEGGIRVWRIK